jgi:hypothetical protein
VGVEELTKKLIRPSDFRKYREREDWMTHWKISKVFKKLGQRLICIKLRAPKMLLEMDKLSKLKLMKQLTSLIIRLKQVQMQRDWSMRMRRDKLI